MRTITKYQAYDGSEWDAESECVKRDDLCERVDAAMAQIGNTPPGVKDGKGWLQHNLKNGFSVVATEDMLPHIPNILRDMAAVIENRIKQSELN